MTAAHILEALEAAGARLALTSDGEGLTLTGKRPPADVLGAVRAAKPALLEALRGTAKEEAAPEKAPASFSPDLPDVSPALPSHLAGMVAAARRGELSRGAHLLGSGLVMDLGGYVLAWAECWPPPGRPGDRAHILRRLGEAHAALTVAP